jgi:hypothetical protein
MLHSLVPEGRTHRLAVVVAGMLRHAVEVTLARFGEDPPEGSVAAALIQVAEEPDPDEESDGIRDLVETLLRDANVAAKRVSARGREYSIVDSAIEQFTSWYAMPWE